MTVTESSKSRPHAARRYLRPPSPLVFPSEETVPETAVHLRLRTALFLILERELRGRAFVGSEQFVYWDPTDPHACLAPDVLVRLGGPLALPPSFKTWEHGAPNVAVEIISRSDSRDVDWSDKSARYRRCGVRELVRFDPEDDEAPLRLWDLVDGELVERDRTAPEAFHCAALDAYWVVRRDEGLGPMLRVARDPAGEVLWPTPDERIAELERALAKVPAV